MTSGLDTTFQILTKTKNEASARVLLDALDVSDRDVQASALKAIVSRKSSSCQKALLRRWHTLSDRWKKVIDDSGGRLSTAIRDAILSKNEQLHENGCNAVLTTREFDLIPTLITAAEDSSNPQANRSAETLLLLADSLSEELEVPRDYRNRRNPQSIRIHAVSALEPSIGRFDQHKRREIVEAFLMLATSRSAVLNDILQHPHNKAYVTVVHVLTHSTRPGVMRLILDFLDDPRAPSAIYSILSRRKDISFVRHMLKRFTDEVPASAVRNLKKIDSFGWLRDDMNLLTALNGEEQCGAIHLTMASGVSRLRVFDVIDFLLINGTVEARRQAAVALSEFYGANANETVIRTLQDEDAVVRATAVSQLRERGIRGAMTTLLDLIDSPDKLVRVAAREALSEFTFERFLTLFGSLDDETLAETARFVRRVDPKAIDGLREELRSPVRMRRIRAVQMAVAMEAIAEIESPVISLLADEDHVIRAAAAEALIQSPSAASRNALREVILDRSQTVREAAEVTLQAFAEAGFGADATDTTDVAQPAIPAVDFDVPTSALGDATP